MGDLILIHIRHVLLRKLHEKDSVVSCVTGIFGLAIHVLSKQ
ncbi:hypothetical protein [Vulcanisaeta thermophila]|nr:hypothetical protein [Vulcanisaeta thermophila]